MKRLIYIFFVGLTINCFGNNPTVHKLDTIGIANKSKRILYQTAEIEKYKSLLKGDFINIDTENRKLQIKFNSDIILESTAGSIYIKAGVDINCKAIGSINQDATSINDLCNVAAEVVPVGER